VKVAVYNRYWQTLGGGERYSGFLAECLSDKHEVELLVHDSFDAELVKDRLDVDLSRASIKVLPDDDITFGYETSGYDLLVNATFGSVAPCRARYGLYLCYFPVPHDRIRKGVPTLNPKRSGARHRSRGAHLEWGDGWFGHEQAKDVYRWSNEQPSLRIWTAKGVETSVQLLFLRLLPRGADPTEIEFSVEGEVIHKEVIEPGRGTIPVTLSLVGKGLYPTVVEMRCNTFRPHEQFGSDDPRHLGVALVADQTGRPANGFTYSRRHYRGGPEIQFLDSYDELVAISQYTQRWISSLWKRPSQILHPPVRLRRPGPKEKVILAVGRFFDERSGHCKKQAELVSAFRALVDRGLSDWTLHLVGGCEGKDVPYLNRVREMASGLPVEISVGASGAELDDLYSRASIFWHATGLGEKERTFPERSEHFGITTVEAMSAGAVPVVIGKAGQLETLVDGVHGRHFSSVHELINQTWQVARDDTLRARYADAAQRHAATFSSEVFRTKLHDLVEETVNR
jgi:glycosyltransferase involved in cell wall biosynthesis